MGSRTLEFAEAARVVADQARRGGLGVPTFRSPPRVIGRDRTIRRRPDGTASVAVRLSGRPFVAVLSDMVEGVVAANRLTGPDADAWRRRLWTALAEQAPELAAVA